MNPAIRRESRFPAHRRLQRRLRPLALAAASLFALASAGAAGPALPTGLAIVQGQASMAQVGNRLTVTNTAGALLDWQQFNIGAGAAVHFAQPSAASKVLNRVLGNDPSSILGSLSSNGQVWLQNPNGVLFGAGARIDVASLVATTLAISNTGWQDGLRTGSFQLGDAGAVGLGGIVNQGDLRSASGGQVLLLGGAGGVRNAGLIHAPDGQVLLAAGAQVDLVDTSAPRVGVRLQAPQGEVLNLGQVLAGNGRIDLQAAMVNQQGIVRADGIGPGGAVVASASEALTLGAGSVTSASGGVGGQVALDAGSGALLASGRIDATASAGLGGQVSLLGRQVGLLDGGTIDASGWAGGGAVRLGGGLQGRDAAYRNADATFLGRGARITADATGRGDGGLVVLWGSDAMRAYGTLSARGGALGGDGGFIETSGGWIDARPLALSTHAPAGRAGQWLLDPYDILISEISGDSDISGPPDFTSTGPQSLLSVATLAAALDAGNNVTVSTGAIGSPGSGSGDIRMAPASASSVTLVVSPTQAVSLTLNAARNINLTGATIESRGQPLTVRLLTGLGGGQAVPSNGTASATGGGAILLQSSRILSAGGDVQLGGSIVACGPVLGCAGGNTGAVANNNLGSNPTPADGIGIRRSTIAAGSGAVRLDGHSVYNGGATRGVMIRDVSEVSGRNITINGTVDSPSESLIAGVEIQSSFVTASERLTVTGRGLMSGGFAGSPVSGVLVSGASTITVGGVTGAGMLLDGRASATSAEPGAFAPIIGVELRDDGTQLLATSNASIELNGRAVGDGVPSGISITASGLTPIIDAAAGSRLTLASDGDLLLRGGGVVAPTGGALAIEAADSLFLDGMQLTGAPATALLRGSLVAIGAEGEGTAVDFSGPTAVTVQSDQFLLGTSEPLTAPTVTQALLASGSGIRIQSNLVYLGLQSMLSSSAAGTAIDIGGRTSGLPVQSFVNDGAATALRADSGRWLLYSVDDTDGLFAPGTLRAGFWQYGYTPGTTALAQGGNGFLFADTPVLSLSGSGVLSKIYDGRNVAGLAAAALSVNGLRSGQRLVSEPVFADPNAGTAKPLALATAGGGYTALTVDDTPVYGYAVDAATMRGTIAPRPLSVLATVVDKIYDGGTSATITEWTLSSVIGSDDLRVSGTAQFESPGVGIGKVVTVAVAPLAGNAAANYDLSNRSLTTSASVTPRPLDLQSVTIADKVYDGTLSATVNNWSLGNVVGQDDVRVSGSTAQFLTTGVGTAKPVSATASGLAGADAANYTAASLQASATASITPRPLVLDAVTVADKVYDGTLAATVGNWSLSNVVAGEQVQVLSGGAVFATPGAGNAKPVTATVTALAGSTAGNYSVDGLTLQAAASITQRPLSLQSVTVADKVYDGGTAATVTAWRLAGVLEGDRVQVQSGSAAFSTPGVGSAKPVSAAVATLGGDAAANYSASGLSALGTASITPATLTYLADVLTLPQGAVLPTLTGTVTGFVGEDSADRATTGTLRFVTDAGAAAPPGRYAVNGTGLAAANYRFVQAEGNATALTLAAASLPPELEVISTVSTTTNTATVAVLSPTVASTPSSGRALDAVPVVTQSVASGGADGAGRRFDSLDLDRMSAGTVAMALAARDAYKNEVFRTAKDELAADPSVADAPGCASQQQAASGQCLLVRPLGSALDISNARVVERAPINVPGATTAAPLPAAAAPVPDRPVAAAAPAAPAAPATPAAPTARIQPMPADQAVNLPRRQTVARAAVPQIQRKIAVLIGIDRYQDERIPQLGNAVADARAVARTLTERLGYETVVLENPGKATIFRTLNQLAGQVGPNDSVVLYYAGHGERIEKTGLGYWQPADADAGRAETWISNADIDRLLRLLPASQLAMVSDSCFSGSLVSGERIRGVPATPDPASLLNKRAVVVMTSGGNEPVFDSGLNGHSPFAWNLMQSLNQVGAQGAGWKPGSSIFEQVRFAVARKLPQRPQYGASSGGGHEQGADYLFEQRQLR